MERSTGLIPGIFIGLGLGVNLMNVLHKVTDDTDQQVEHVQYVNQAVDHILGDDLDPRNLIINLDDHSFQFDTNVRSGVEEHCSGRYSQEENVIKLSGNLSCSQTVDVTGGQS